MHNTQMKTRKTQANTSRYRLTQEPSYLRNTEINRADKEAFQRAIIIEASKEM